MSQVTLYHNPRCSKSREALKLLQSKGIEPTIVEYLNNPLNETQLKSILKKLQLKPIDIIRVKEPEFKTLGLTAQSTAKAHLAALTTHPKLMERPIIVIGNKAAIGRPPENILEIL